MIVTNDAFLENNSYGFTVRKKNANLFISFECHEDFVRDTLHSLYYLQELQISDRQKEMSWSMKILERSHDEQRGHLKTNWGCILCCFGHNIHIVP